MDFPRRPSTQRTERLGVNFVRSVVEAENCLFHEIAGGNDYGNDAFVEIVEDHRVTGVCVAFQIKSGQSYCSKDACQIPYTARQANYWNNHSLPVYGVVYDPDEDRAYWTVLSGRVGRGAMGGGIVRLAKSSLGRFDRENFRQVLLPRLLKQPPALELLRAAEFASSSDPNEHRLGVYSLFFGYRNSVVAWQHLEDLLLTRPHAELPPWVCISFAHIPGHGDILWHPRNMIEDGVKRSILEKMSVWGESHVRKLLQFVDENGTERGSVGQNVEAIISCVAQPAVALRKFAFCVSEEDEVRRNALHLYLLHHSSKRENEEAVELALADPVLADLAENHRVFNRQVPFDS